MGEQEQAVGRANERGRILRIIERHIEHTQWNESLSEDEREIVTDAFRRLAKQIRSG